MPQDLKPRTKVFALRIIRLYSKLPKNDTVAQVLGRQVLRSGTSVGANYREASRGRSKAEFISQIGDCLKEIEETNTGSNSSWTAVAFRRRTWPACSTKPANSSPYSQPLTRMPKVNAEDTFSL
jgi:four helix bundle protein